MKRLAPLLITVFLAIYPLLVWQGVERVGAPTLLGLLLAALGLRAAVLARGRKQVRIAGFVLVVAGIAAAVTRTGDVEPLRWYPVLASLVASTIFAASLLTGRPLIERLARLRSPDLPPEGVSYTRRLTLAWALLTLGNALIALWTVLFADLETWALYNGFLSYLLLGGFFVLECCWRLYRFGRASV